MTTRYDIFNEFLGSCDLGGIPVLYGAGLDFDRDEAPDVYVRVFLGGAISDNRTISLSGCNISYLDCETKIEILGRHSGNGDPSVCQVIEDKIRLCAHNYTGTDPESLYFGKNPLRSISERMGNGRQPWYVLLIALKYRINKVIDHDN